MIAYPLFRLAGNLINSCLNLAINDILDGFSGGNNVCTVLLKDITHILSPYIPYGNAKVIGLAVEDNINHFGGFFIVGILTLKYSFLISGKSILSCRKCHSFH